MESYYWRLLPEIIRSLRSECPVEDMAAGNAHLQDYIANAPLIGEYDPFYDQSPFEIFDVIIYSTERIKHEFGMNDVEMSRSIRRFELYTWNQHHDAAIAYFRARKHAAYVANYNGIFDNPPHFGESLGRVAGRHEFKGCKSLPKIDELSQKARETEEGYRDVPRRQGFMLNKRDKRNARRIGMLRKLRRALMEEAQEAEEPLRKLGHEYRRIYLAEHYPQCDIFDLTAAVGNV